MEKKSKKFVNFTPLWHRVILKQWELCSLMIWYGISRDKALCLVLTMANKMSLPIWKEWLN